MPEEKQNDLKRAQDLKDLCVTSREQKEIAWKENINWYEGFQGPGSSNENETAIDLDWVTFNLIRSGIKILAPSIYFRNPKVFLSPRRAQDLNRREINELVLNYEISQMKLKIQMKRAVTDALLTNFGCIKLGFDSEFRINDNEKSENPTENTFVSPGSIWNLRVSPFDFHIDPAARNLDLSDARFVVHSVDRFLDDVKNDKWFDNRTGLKASSFMGSKRKEHDNEIDDEFLDRAEGMDHRDMIRVHEFWDRNKKEVLIFADDHPKLLKKMKWPWELDGFPFVILTFLYAPDKLYARTDVENSLDAQDAINQHVSQILAHGRRSLPRLGVKKKVKPETIQKLEEPYVDALIHGLDEGDIFQIPQSKVVPEVFNFVSMARDMLNINLGTTELQRGQVPRGTRTATVAGILQQNTQLTLSEKVDVVQDFFQEIMEKDLKLIHQTYDQKKIVPIVGAVEGVFDFREYTGKEIEGQFDVEIEPFSATPRNPETERQEAIAYVNLMGHPSFANDPTVGLSKLELAGFLSRKFDIKQLDKILPLLGQKQRSDQPRDPVQENTLLAAGADLPVSPNDNDDEHITIHSQGMEIMVNEGLDVTKFQAHIQLHVAQQSARAAQQQQGQGQDQNPGLVTGAGGGLVPGLEQLLQQNGGQQIQTPGSGEIPASENQGLF